MGDLESHESVRRLITDVKHELKDIEGKLKEKVRTKSVREHLCYLNVAFARIAFSISLRTALIHPSNGSNIACMLSISVSHD